MTRTRYLMLAVTASALAAAPAHAGGLLGGGLTAPVIGNGSIVGNVTGSVGKSLELTTSRSIDPRGGSNITAGVAGSVSSVAGAAAGANGLGQSIGLAGSSSTNASAEKEAGIGVPGIGATPVRALAGNVRGAANGSGSALAGAGSSAAAVAGSAGAMIGATAAGAMTSGQQVSAFPGGISGSGSLAGTVSSAANGMVSAGSPVGENGQVSLGGALNSAASGALAAAGGAAAPKDGQDEPGESARSAQGTDKSARNRKPEPRKHPRR
ncbi:MAG: hypothetical protein LOX97_10840 [Sphingomonas sp.]|nr:hypothetical protein [Sphingomonas sp.]